MKNLAKYPNHESHPHYISILLRNMNLMKRYCPICIKRRKKTCKTNFCLRCDRRLKHIVQTTKSYRWWRYVYTQSYTRRHQLADLLKKYEDSGMVFPDEESSSN